MEGQTPPNNMRVAPGGVLDPTAMPLTLRLPAPPTPFIGREREVADVCALLNRPAVRLVTLAGPGGIGKTRLALAVAEALRAEFPEGVYAVSLSTLTDSRLVLQAIAQALGMRDALDFGVLTREPAILEHLEDLIDHRKLLLVLDNFEQVIDAATQLAQLLSTCLRLKILVTSREMLRLSAEHCYPVPPLVLPDLQHLPPLEFLARVEAIRLFVTRAQAAQPDFELTTANAMTVATICHHLDGLPLAIELAAARVRLLPPAQMLSRLEHRLPWLTGGARDAPARHQTLSAAIGWSYDLLEPDEQQLFRRLSVFVGGCTLDAIESVCAAVDGTTNGSGNPHSALRTPQLFTALASLVDKSLLRQDHNGAAEQGRLYMLETIREYALEQLESSGEAGDIHRAHALYFLAIAEDAETELIGPDQHAWLVRLEQEHDNLRAALAWALATGNSSTEIGARLAAPLWRFWLTRGHMSEGRRWLETVLAANQSLPTPLRARVLNGAGRLALRQGDYASAKTQLEESLALWRTLGDMKGELQALDNLALVALYQNDLPQARGYLEESLTGWRALGDKQGIAATLNRLGLVLRYQDEYDRATQYYEECLALARELHDKYLVAAPLHNLGQMLHHLGDDATAHRLLVESFLLVRQMGDVPNISVWLADLAGVWVAQGQPLQAAHLFGAAEAHRENMTVVMYEAQRIAYQKDVERGRAQLGDATWDAAWAEGRAMSLDDACALALEDLSPAIAVPETPSATPAAVPQNTYDLTERELEVLRLLVEGLTYAQIAEQLTLSFHTVHAHMRSIYSKLGVTSRSQASRFASEHALLTSG